MYEFFTSLLFFFVVVPNRCELTYSQTSETSVNVDLQSVGNQFLFVVFRGNNITHSGGPHDRRPRVEGKFCMTLCTLRGGKRKNLMMREKEIGV